MFEAQPGISGKAIREIEPGPIVRAQYINLPDQQIRAPFQQVDRKEIYAARDLKAAVVRHTPQGTLLGRADARRAGDPPS